MRISDWSSDVCSSDLISKFGGHAMAAGLSLPQANFGAFAAAFDAEVRRQLCEDDLTGRLLTERTSGVEGKSVSVRVDRGGRRILKKNNRQQARRDQRTYNIETKFNPQS